MYTAALIFAIALSQPQADADRVVDEQTETKTATSAESLGLSLGLTISPIFNDRGANVLSSRGQMGYQLVLMPTARYTFGAEGPYLSYMGVFKAGGEDMDVGANGLQLLRAGWQSQLLDDALRVDGGLGLALFPGADPELVRDGIPVVLEPFFGLTWTTPVLTPSLSMILSHHVQDELSLARHLYVQPSVARSFPLEAQLELNLVASAGFKVFGEGGPSDRRLDLATQVGVAIDTGSLTLTPALHAAWLDLEDESFEDEYMAWGSLGIAADL